MESIIQLRQMMADHKFFEVQRLVEVQLTLNSDSRHELLLLYFDSLEAQKKKIPTPFLLELSGFEANLHHHEFVHELLKTLNNEANKKYFVQIQKLKIKAAEDNGQINELYFLLNEFLLRQFEKKIPSIPLWVTSVIEKYFRQDFGLKLKELAQTLLFQDFLKAETITSDLVISCVEKSSPKGVSEKLSSIGEILKTCSDKGQLEVYQNFCVITANGITDKTDYKRIVEMVLFFEDFKFQVLVLNLLVDLELNEVAQDYASDIKTNPNYDFVYLDKFFTQLKKYFVSTIGKDEATVSILVPAIDLKLDGKIIQEIISPLRDVEEYEEEHKYFNIIKHETFTPNQLCDLAVSFLQSDMPRVAKAAAEQARKQTTEDYVYLKASYLLLNTQLLLKDFRAGLDTCLEAISKAKTKDEVLSFLYAQAEIYIRLGQKKDAKTILQKIISIDSDYRFAQERLDKLNEI